MRPQLDIVVVSYNSRDHLRSCVEAAAVLPEANVVVVDNASQDGSLETLAGLPVTAIALDDNVGFAAGCNAGWRSCAAPYVLFLNPDARIDAASLRRLVAVLEDEPEAGIAAPKIVHPDGALHFSLRRFPRLASTYGQALFLHRVFPRAAWADELVRDPRAYDAPSSPEWASGACLLVRRPLLERLGGFDERYFMYSEDTDLCRRVRNLGFDVRYEPSAVAVHVGGASAPRARMLPVLTDSRLHYARRHRSRAGAFADRIGLAVSSLTHALVGNPELRSGHVRSLRKLVRP